MIKYIKPLLVVVLICQVVLWVLGYPLLSRGWHQILTLSAMGIRLMQLYEQSVGYYQRSEG